MKKILVPTDFSDASRNASVYAAQLAKDFNAVITLFHVYHFPTVVSEVPIMIVTPEELEEQNNRLLQKEVNYLKDKVGVEAQYKAVVGLTVDEIIVESPKFDLVVMGMQGAGSLSETLIGSIATATIKQVKQPLMVVPKTAGYTQPNTIVFACDKLENDYSKAVAVLKSFSAAFLSKIVVLNVKAEVAAQSVAGTVAGGVWLSKLSNAEFVSYSANENDVTESINEFAENKKADMIALVPHHYNFLENLFHKSITKKMAFHSHLPLLAIPE